MPAPKTEGETYLRILVAKTRGRVQKMEDAGKSYDNPIVSMPLDKAEQIVDMFVHRKDKLGSIVQLLEEIEFRLVGEIDIEDVEGLLALSRRALKLAKDAKDFK